MTGKALMEQICQLGQLHIEGNIVPPSWYQHLKYPSGKPYHIAITLLSEIVYWFRPRMVRDEHTGEFAGWAKKFRGDGIQRSYAAWGAPFGFTKRESADAVKYLVSEGLITTEIRDITLADGTLRPNVVVVTGVSPERLREITYSRRPGGSVPPGRHTSIGYYPEKEEVLPQNVIPFPGYNISTDDLVPDNVSPSSESGNEGHASTRNCLETKIETKHETNNENSYQPVNRYDTKHVDPITDGKTNDFINHEVTDEPADVQSISPVSPRQAETEKSSIAAQTGYPVILIKPNARKGILELGQRVGRDDLAFPNIASVYLWMARAWHLLLVQDPLADEQRQFMDTLSTLEGMLSSIRERAVREKQLTFSQVLDEYLSQDEALRAFLRDAQSPLARLSEFSVAIKDILQQWDDAPTADELALLRSLLDGDGGGAAA